MGYGSSPYGLSPWGGAGLSIGLHVYMARVISEREVQVSLTMDPMATSPIGEGDALNPASWKIRLAGGPELTVLNATQLIDSDGDPVPREFVLYTLEKFASYLYVLEAGSDTLVDKFGDPIGYPRYAQFQGCQSVAEAQPRHDPLDFENMPFDTNRPAGTLMVGSDGDYRMHSGEAFYRKMIMRRITTVKRGLFHLPDFGENLRVNEPVYPSDMISLRAEIQRELLKEPDFAEVSSRLTLYNDGRLYIEVRVKLMNGQTVKTNMEAING